MIEKLVSIAKKAGSEILKIYSDNFSVKLKEDRSPLTEADLRSQEVILDGLNKNFPNIPVITEESANVPYDKRKGWKEFFLVDPLDGTKEFISRNGEFTVNIALIKDKKPILGVVYVPVKDICYYADSTGAYKDGEKISSRQPEEILKIVASKSHFSQETKDFIDKLGKQYELVNVGSSLKFCLVAEGKADIYPRLGFTMEWDTAAAHCIVNAAGKHVYIFNSKEELHYNKENLQNPWFVVK